MASEKSRITLNDIAAGGMRFSLPMRNSFLFPSNGWTRCAVHFQANNIHVHQVLHLVFAVTLLDFRALEVIVVSFRITLQFALDGYAVADVVGKLYRCAT